MRNAEKNRPVMDIYIARLPEELPERHFFCEEREKEIRETSNPALRRSRSFDWEILLYAAKCAFGLQEEEIRFFKSPSGKWCCEQFFFSLSHTQSAAAVGISDAAIGIDIENLAARRRLYDSDASFAERLRRKICASEKELADNEKSVLQLWILKESIYKCYGGQFDPAAIETDRYCAEVFSCPAEPGLPFAVCGEGLKEARFFCYENGSAYPIRAEAIRKENGR